MKIIKYLLSFVALCFLSAASLQAFAKPSECPTTTSIILGGLKYVEHDSKYKLYVGITISQYNSNDKWGFIIAMPSDQATDKTDARNKLTTALNTLKGNPTPKSDGKGHWVCMYDNAYDYLSGALTPVKGTTAMIDSLKKPSFITMLKTVILTTIKSFLHIA